MRAVQVIALVLAGLFAIPYVVLFVPGLETAILPPGPGAGMAWLGYAIFVGPILVGGSLLVAAIAGFFT